MKPFMIAVMTISGMLFIAGCCEAECDTGCVTPPPVSYCAAKLPPPPPPPPPRPTPPPPPAVCNPCAAAPWNTPTNLSTAPITYTQVL